MRAYAALSAAVTAMCLRRAQSAPAAVLFGASLLALRRQGRSKYWLWACVVVAAAPSGEAVGFGGHLGVRWLATVALGAAGRLVGL